MCEIFVMFKANNTNIQKNELERFLKRAVTSGARNSDGYGVLCEKYHMRDPEQFNFNHVKEIIKDYNNDSRFFAVHTRLATCEKKIEFNHPFKMDKFLGIHNGVVSVDGQNSGSDSLDLFTEINDYSKNEKYLYNAIVKAMHNVSGSYSVLIYAFKEHKLYYYRNSPSFDFMYIPKSKIVYGATDIDRLKCLDYRALGFFETAYFSRPLQKKLYCIDLKTGRFNRIATITEKERTYVYKASDNNDKQSRFSGWGYGRDNCFY